MILASVDSTNAEAFRLAPSLTGPLWILAGEQTAGRGRRARPWTSPQGNFHGTLAMQVTEPPATVALRAFAAALALAPGRPHLQTTAKSVLRRLPAGC